LSDSWYASLENLRLISSIGWHRLTRLKANRSVNPDGRGNIPLSVADISESGTEVHLKGYGFIKVFRIVTKDGSAEHWATDYIQLYALNVRLSYCFPIAGQGPGKSDMYGVVSVFGINLLFRYGR